MGWENRVRQANLDPGTKDMHFLESFNLLFANIENFSKHQLQFPFVTEKLADKKREYKQFHFAVSLGHGNWLNN